MRRQFNKRIDKENDRQAKREEKQRRREERKGRGVRSLWTCPTKTVPPLLLISPRKDLGDGYWP
jgi:hypothetical protein